MYKDRSLGDARERDPVKLIAGGLSLQQYCKESQMTVPASLDKLNNLELISTEKKSLEQRER